ncbi:hypothetical protein [Azorhizobium doebereinerae]|uniref:hypothetical protein n=1 Tax=Azorhizobium doebereinerae TaxID=281091 RepID=UPI000429F249|nr:hypothetical protein [Azorhizobium doebereinerae]
MIAGLCGGLWRLGWTLPHGVGLAALHGPLMISGAFGALISLERAVAVGRDWSYLAPILAAAGSLALLAGLPPEVGAAGYVLASGVLFAATLLIACQQPALFTAVLLLGAAAWLSGNVLWLLGRAVPDVAGWWLAFLIFTIGGERLEMSRLLERKRGSEVLFLFAAGLVAAGARNGITTHDGAVLFGLGLLGTAAWLARHDLAMKTVRLSGQARFCATAMLAGYAWMAVAGVALIARGPDVAPYGYDVALHAVLIGFVLSMVFGHALIIIPAVARVRLRYQPVLYGPLALLHLSALLRVAGGLLEIEEMRRVSGPLTLLAMVAFAACLFYGARAKGRRPVTAN